MQNKISRGAGTFIGLNQTTLYFVTFPQETKNLSFYCFVIHFCLVSRLYYQDGHLVPDTFKACGNVCGYRFLKFVVKCHFKKYIS